MDVWDNLVKDGGGGTPIDFVMDIYNTYIKDKNIERIVEIGVYNGCFLLPIASLCDAQTYGIDPYTSFVQHDIDNPTLYKLATNISTNQNFLNNVYNRLMNNIEKFGLNTIIIKQCAEHVHHTFDDNSIDILRIDGNHDSAYVTKDLNLFADKVKVNGIVLMDDTNWKSVKNAMNKYLESNNQFVLERIEPFWSVLRKIRQ